MKYNSHSQMEQEELRDHFKINKYKRKIPISPNVFVLIITV